MTSKQRRRLAFAIALLVAGAVGAGVIGYELKNNIQYFQSPSDILAHNDGTGVGVAFHLGGLIEKGSVQHGAGTDVRFAVTDGNNSVKVDYNGVLPALFREGQGVVALGAMDSSGTFVATEVLAKHDEKYMPPEVVQELKRSGHWKEGEQ